MKTVLLTALALIFTVQAKAVMIEGSEIEKYKQAVNAYLTAAKVTQCNSKRLVWQVDVLVERAQTLELSNGDQPFMTFTYRSKESSHGFDLFQVNVETISASFEYNQFSDADEDAS